MTNHCPSCGFNLKRDELVERDGFTLDPRGAVSYLGRPLPLSPTARIMMHTLASQKYDRPVSYETLGNRTDSDALDLPGVMKVQFHRIKRVLETYGVPDPLQLVWGRGWRWKSPLSHADVDRYLGKIGAAA